MSESSIAAPPSVSFEQAIQFTRFLVDRIEQGDLKGSALQAAVSGLVGSRDGARGFFVAYLTDPRPLADVPSPEILDALRTAPAVIPELIAKNLVMSATQAVVHIQKSDPEGAKGSERVRKRTADLITQLGMPEVWQALDSLLQSLNTGEGEYQDFLERWRYSAAQKAYMREVLEAVMGEVNVITA